MALAHDIPDLDRKGLRDFGLTTGAILVVLFGLALPWVLDHGYPRWPWWVGGILAAWGLMAPTSLRPVYRGWMRFGLLMSKVMTPLVMGIVFFVVITPVSFIMRLRGRDTMSRKLDGAEPSYRIKSVKRSTNSLEKPF